MPMNVTKWAGRLLPIILLLLFQETRQEVSREQNKKKLCLQLIITFPGNKIGSEQGTEFKKLCLQLTIHNIQFRFTGSLS